MENLRQGVEIIAEVANAHEGSPELALTLAREAVGAGADAVKFQIYSADEMLVRAHPRFEHFRQFEFSSDEWHRIVGAVRRTVSAANVHAAVYADVFGVKALEIARSAGVDGYKVHSSDLGNVPLLETLSKVAGRLFVAVGGSSHREIVRALAILQGEGAVLRRPVLLHGYQVYSTPPEEAALDRLCRLAELYGGRCDLGYMDHVDGAGKFAQLLPVLSMAYGVVAIEKHVTLDRSKKGTDHYSSLEPPELHDFIATVRVLERAMTSTVDSFTPSERKYRRAVKKHWVAAREVACGERLYRNDLVMKRTGPADVECVDLDDVIGRSTVRPLAAEETVTRSCVRHTVWALIVARAKSQRLPGKALLPVGGRTALEHLLLRATAIKGVSRTVLCTTTDESDDSLVEVARKAAVPVFRGPVEDVLGRMLGAIGGEPVDAVLRITGDDIMVDPGYADVAIRHHFDHNLEYSDLKQLPSGTEVEVFDTRLLRLVWDLAEDRNGTEYLTAYVRRYRDQFKCGSVPVEARHARPLRLTIDTPADYDTVKTFIEHMRTAERELSYTLDDVIAYFDTYPGRASGNAHVAQRGLPATLSTYLDWRRAT